MDETVYLLLGSDTGDREAYLAKALREISRYPDTSLRALSSVYETEPVGMEKRGRGRNFLNLCCAVETSLGPFSMLEHIRSTEQSLGRHRTRAKRGGGPYRSRTLDIDILLYGGRIIHTRELIIPHPRLPERLFALEPLSEIAGEALHPLFRLTVSELKDRSTDIHFVRYLKKMTDVNTWQ